MIIVCYASLIIVTLVPIIYSKIIFDKLLNPITLITIFGLPIQFFYYFAPALLEVPITDGLLLAYQVEVLYVLIQHAIVILIISSRQFHLFDYIVVKNRELSSQNLMFCSLAFFILFLVFFYVLASSSVGVIEWISNPRYSYINYRRGYGEFYALAINFLALSAFFAFFNSKNFVTLSLKFLFFVSIIMVFGSKGVVLRLIALLLIVDLLNFKFKIGKYILMLPVLVGVIFYIVVSSGITDVLSFLKYFDYFSNARMYYDDYLNGSVELFHGKIWISSFWGIVPRSIFEMKPIVYGALHIVEIYYPGGPASGNTPAFGARVFEFSDFGILGVIGSAIFDPWNILYSIVLVIIFKNKYGSHRKNQVTYFGLALLFSPQFGVFFGGISFIFFMIIVFGVIKLATNFKYGGKNDILYKCHSRTWRGV